MPQYLKGRLSPWRVQMRDADGKLVTRSFLKKEDAVSLETKLRRERGLVKAGLDSAQTEITFLEACQWFLKKRKINPDIADSTVRADESRLWIHWIERFGPRLIHTITQEQISEHLDHLMEKGMGAATRNRNRTLIHNLFEYVRKSKRYNVILNPVQDIEVFSEKLKRRKTGHWETMEEVEKYIDAAYIVSPVYGTLATVLLYGGPRIGEALALTFGDVDQSRHLISIRATLTRGSKPEGIQAQIAERTKGQGAGDGYELPLFPRVADAISKHRKSCVNRGDEDFIFQNEQGSFLSYFTYYDAHKRIIKNAGLKYITLHDLRRTYATHLESHGFSREDVQKVLGHSSIETTQTYIRRRLDPLVAKGLALGFGSTRREGNESKRH